MKRDGGGGSFLWCPGLSSEDRFSVGASAFPMSSCLLRFQGTSGPKVVSL